MSERLALLARLEAKLGKGDELARFLEAGRALVEAQAGTVSWHALKISETSSGHLRNRRCAATARQRRNPGCARAGVSGSPCVTA
jgi:hypothetical protein